MSWQPPKFDRFQFEKSSRAIYARYTPQGWETSGLGFSDFARHNNGAGSMRVHWRESRRQRRLDTPSWATNDAELREVLLKFCERRVLVSLKRVAAVAGLTQEERVNRVRQLELMRAKECEQNLIALRQRWKTEPEETKPKLETQITNFDTQLRDLRRGNLALAAGVVYFYFRLGYHSVEVARELGIKPPHVRQILARLDLAARGIVYCSPKFQRLREVRAEMKRIKLLFKKAKAIIDAENRKATQREIAALAAKVQTPQQTGKARRWTYDRLMFVYYLRLQGKSWEHIAPKLGIQHGESAKQGFTYYMENLHLLLNSI